MKHDVQVHIKQRSCFVTLRFCRRDAAIIFFSETSAYLLKNLPAKLHSLQTVGTSDKTCPNAQSVTQPYLRQIHNSNVKRQW